MLLMKSVEAKDDIEALWCHVGSVVVRRCLAVVLYLRPCKVFSF